MLLPLAAEQSGRFASDASKRFQALHTAGTDLVSAGQYWDNSTQGERDRILTAARTDQPCSGHFSRKAWAILPKIVQEGVLGHLRTAQALGKPPVPGISEPDVAPQFKPGDKVTVGEGFGATPGIVRQDDGRAAAVLVETTTPLQGTTTVWLARQHVHAAGQKTAQGYGGATSTSAENDTVVRDREAVPNSYQTMPDVLKVPASSEDLDKGPQMPNLPNEKSENTSSEMTPEQIEKISDDVLRSIEGAEGEDVEPALRSAMAALESVLVNSELDGKVILSHRQKRIAQPILNANDYGYIAREIPGIIGLIQEGLSKKHLTPIRTAYYKLQYILGQSAVQSFPKRAPKAPVSPATTMQLPPMTAR